MIIKPEAQELRNMHANLCQAIADPTRIALLYELGESPKHVNQLVESLAVPQATVSRHLKILRDRALVTTRRDGPYIYYRLAEPRVLEALEIMRGIMGDVMTRHHTFSETAAS